MLKPKFIYDFGISQDDPESELRVLKPNPGDRLLCIASGGEVPLELLVNSDPEVDIDAVDISEVQLYLSHLKLQAVIHLQGKAAEFLGYLPATKAERTTWFESFNSALSHEEVGFWNANPKIFEKGPIHCGRYETYIARFAPLGRWLLGGKKKLMGLFECTGTAQQQEYFDRELRTQMLKILFRIMFSRRLYTNRGVSEQGLIHMDETGAGLRFFNKFRGFCTRTPARGNWYLQFMLFGRLLFEEALPGYLTAGGQEKLRSGQHRLQFFKQSYTDMIAENPVGYYNKFALSNVSDWLSQKEMMELMKLIGKRAGPNGRGLIRYLHASGITPGALPVTIKLKTEAGEKLLEQDRFPFYNLIPFEIEETGDSRGSKSEGAVSQLYQTRELGPEWNDRLLQIARESPLKVKGLRILFDRSPDIFAVPKLTSRRYRCGGLFRENKLLGFAIGAFQKRYTGERRLGDVMYLGSMHVSEDEQGKGFFYKTSDFFFGHLPKEVEFCYAYIMEANSAALKFINHRHPRFPSVPYSMAIGKIAMLTIFLSVPIRQPDKFTIRVANAEDIDQIVSLLQQEHENRFLAPAMDRAIFMKNLEERPDFGIENYIIAETENDLVGVCAAWDMTAFKQNRIVKYSRKWETVRRLYNGAAKLLGALPLPEAGEAFRDITIAEYAVRDRNPDILEALLRYSYHRFRKEGYHSIIFGSSVDDPLLEVGKHFLSKEVRSYVVLGSDSWEKLSDKQGVPLIYADAVQI